MEGYDGDAISDQEWDCADQERLDDIFPVAAAPRHRGTRKFKGELEIDADRGVICFHVDDKEAALEYGSVSILRICNLPTPIPKRALDVTHLVGCDWDGRPGKLKRESL